MYSTTLPLPSALDGDEWCTPHPSHCTTGTDPVPFVQDSAWAPEVVWMSVENLAPTGMRSPDCPSRSKSLYQLCYTKVLIKTQKSELNF